VLASERLFTDPEWLHYGITGIGLGLIVAVTVARGWTLAGSKGGRRNIERTLFVCSVGVLVGLLVYALSTPWGMAKIASDMSDVSATRLHTTLTVLFAVLLVASLVPLIMIELSLGTSRRDTFDLEGDSAEAVETGGVDFFRVREVGWSGLSVALAASFLMVTCSVAKERDVDKDVSYFRTSSPGDSTISIVTLAPDAMRALLFFPEGSEVTGDVRGYFDDLASATNDKIAVEVHDRYKDSTLATKYKVRSDEKLGMVVLVRGVGDKEKFETFDVDIDADKERKTNSKLRNLDREVNKALLKLVRDKRKAYLTTGHGEMNDPDSIPPDLKGRIPDRKVSVLKKRLADLNYEVKDLGLVDLVKEVPDDATIVFVLAPTVPLQPAEWAAFDRYLDRGGRMLIALDPKSEPSMGQLEGRLGYTYDPTPLTDDKVFLPQHHSPADHRWPITTQFSAHSSTTALSRAVDKGLVLIESGSFADTPFTDKTNMPKKTVTIHSMDSSFLDYNDDLEFTPDGPKPEKRGKYDIAAAVEGPKLGKDENGKDKDGFRVLLFADVDLFGDIVVQNQGRMAVLMVSGPLLEDSVRWLGGEEVFSGEVVSEEDKPIQHTKEVSSAWFALTIFGAPMLVLGLGMLLSGTLTRRTKASSLARHTGGKKS
jgi:hypothetical protein